MERIIYWIAPSLAAAPTPQAQEDEVVYQSFCEGTWDDVTKERYEWAMQRGMKYYRKLYTRPQSDELRKAAQELVRWLDDDSLEAEMFNEVFNNLRTALERK